MELNTSILKEVRNFHYENYLIGCSEIRKQWAIRNYLPPKAKVRYCKGLKDLIRAVREKKIVYKALDKQLPAKPIDGMLDTYPHSCEFPSLNCPSCNTALSFKIIRKLVNYCPVCGQKIES